MTDSVDRKKLIVFLLAAASAAAAAFGARAQNDNEPASLPASPVVVELFTSQACSSCVSAVKLFDELAAREDIVALSWHVDYWNLLNTKHGRWSDPYSDASYTERQRQYNKNIRHRSSVYTPQMVVAGAGEAAGSSKEKVEKLINAAYAERVEESAVAGVHVSRAGGEVVFDIGASENGGNAYLVKLAPQVETKVTRGENAGVAFSEVNVVTGVRPLGVVRRVGAEITTPAPGANENCALIVQEPKQGRIIAAAYCNAS